MVVPGGAGHEVAPATASGLTLRLSLKLGEQSKSNSSSRIAALAARRPEPVLRLNLSHGLLRIGSSSGAVSPSLSASARGPDRQSAAGGSVGGGTRPEPAKDAPDSPETPIPFDPRPAGAARRPTEQVPAAVVADLPDIGGTGWGMAPIRWSGNTTTSINSTSSEGSSSFSDVNTVSVQANSFFGAPYIAQWNANGNYNLTNSTISGGSEGQTKGRTGGLGFGGSVAIFPVSRYPLSVSYSQGSYTTQVKDSNQETKTANFSVRQQYQPEEGPERYGLSFSRNSYQSTLATSTTASLQGNFSTNRKFDYEHFLEGDHMINASFGLNSNDSDAFGLNSKLLSTRISHGWRVHEDLNISNSVDFSHNRNLESQNSTSGINSFGSNTANLFLATTAVTWRPDEDIPLTISGTGNLSQTQVSSNGAASSQLNLGAAVSATYRYNNNLSLSGSASINSSATATDRIISNTQSVSASYSGNPMRFMDFNYGWGTGVGLFRNSSTAGTGYVGTNVSASHSLSRALVINPTNAVNLTANQGISHSTGEQGATSSFSNSAGVSWTSRLGDVLSGNLSANVSDSINRGTTGSSRFQTANFMGGGTYQISQRAAATMNAGLTWSRFVNGDVSQQAINGVIINNLTPAMSGSVTMGYSHRSPFSIPRLTYNANLVFVNSASNQRLENADSQLAQGQQSISLQHILDYRVGKLAFLLNFATIDQAGRKSASLFGSVSRDFDGFFDGGW